MRSLILACGLFLFLPVVSYAADDLDGLLQSYSSLTKTLQGASATLVSDVQASHNAAEGATRLETYAIVYHSVAEAFKNLFPAFRQAKSAGSVTEPERQSMLESSQRMIDLGKLLSSQSDALDAAIKPYMDDARFAAAVNRLLNEAQAMQAAAKQAGD